jgi:Ni,Fe-hydrogenase III large subunit
MNYIQLKNNQTIPFSSIPELDYQTFMATNLELMKSPENHCVNYYGIPLHGRVKLVCCIANDKEHAIYVSATISYTNISLTSFTAHEMAFERFEREIGENFNIHFHDHPWMKPVRYAHNRKDKDKIMDTYPFYKIESDELHEVGVGPIHAGVIEPGHFRFLCNGEQILHLEIQLGYQHRGIEQLFTEKKKLLQRVTLAESIAGDTVVGHTTAFSNLWESLCGIETDPDLDFTRTLAQEMERIAIHTGDLSALCTDIAYQLGSSVFGRLRTPIINYFQVWCGNRLSKGLIRPGKTNFPFTGELATKLNQVFDQYEPDFLEMNTQLFTLSSTLARFEKTGIVTNEQAKAIGAVGMSARMSGIPRDIRLSHPYNNYQRMSHRPVIKEHGDVNARVQIRRDEIIQSMGYVRNLLQTIPTAPKHRTVLPDPSPDSFTISLVEGWRGEICHCAVTDSNGELIHYKIKDPSFHNWMALALAVRNNEISDFPISNKSFDLSYCGHDL